jgi:hypothetical protein
MREITGNLWDYYGKPNTVVLITTNGFVKKNGEAVMGRGCALEATRKFPGIARILGDLIHLNGNTVFEPVKGVYTFPVKHDWFDEADLLLIAQSAQFLKDRANATPDTTYVLPRPGCGNGRRTWAEVKPLLESLPDNVQVITYA